MRLTAGLAACVLAGLVVGCSDGSDYVYEAPATVEEVGDELWQIHLTEGAARRTGVEITAVTEEAVDGVDRLVIPYSAVIYHFDGTTWAYTNPEELTYLRAPIEVEEITGDSAYLTSGPEPGTGVVSVGAAELYGVEFGVGK